MSKIYIVGSMRNPKIPQIANELEAAGHQVFADWYASGPEADVCWRKYEMARGRSYLEALNGPHARHVLEFDRHWLEWADAAVLVAPAGKSGHLELGYMLGDCKTGIILLEDPNPERWDIMFGLADLVTADLDQVKDFLT